MEIRLKYSYSGLVLFSIVFIAFVVGGFLLSYVCWILGILWGGIVVFCIVDAVKHGGDAVVITEEGVWVDGEFEVDWSEIDHCYVSIRTGADHSDNYCLVFVTKQRNRCDLLLDRYIVKYIFSTKKLAKDINHLLGKEMCHMTPADKAYEKRYCLSLATTEAYGYLLRRAYLDRLHHFFDKAMNKTLNAGSTVFAYNECVIT